MKALLVTLELGVDVPSFRSDGSRLWRIAVKGGVDEGGQAVWIVDWGERCRLNDRDGGSAWLGWNKLLRVCKDSKDIVN